jgi:glycosyltransferase involved in cell wall biosynthesis
MSKSQPLITVLMPCYNAMPFLVEALESIINQTYSNLEILCINDGSSDETGAILEKYALQDKRIRVIHNETNIKLIKTLNKGIELAQGEFIARMDADDISELNRIEIELNFFTLNPHIDIVGTGYTMFTEAGKYISKTYPRQLGSRACFFASFFYVPIGHAEILAKSYVLKDNPFLNQDYAIHTEDYELWTRMLRGGYCLNNINEILYNIRINSQSVSRKYTLIQDENFVECAKRHYFEYTQQYLPVEVVKVFVNRIDKMVTIDDFKKGLNEMDYFLPYFLSKENINDSKTKNEILVVFYTHLFDICFQVIKRAAPKIKLYAVFTLFSNIQMIFYKDVLIYLKNKIF